MISKEYGKYCIVCDLCNETEEYDSWDEAVEAKKDNGWKSIKRIDDWCDICPECQKI